MKKILVFTGGGLAPALNATLYGVISAARKKGMKVLGGMYGWASLLRQGKIIDLDKLDIEPIKNIGGTFLRSSRTNPLSREKGMEEILETVKNNSIDCIIAIGGNDTLGAARKIWEEYKIPIVAIPKTVDNDLSGTYWTPGYPSAAYCFSQFVKEIKLDAAYALRRIFVIEAPGMHAGWIAASGSFGGADVIIPPEKPINLNSFLDILSKRYNKNSQYATVVISQEADLGAQLCSVEDDQEDEFGAYRRQLICLSVRDEIKNKLGIDAKMLYPGNYIESGNPIALDRDLAVEVGEEAVRLAIDHKFGHMPCLVRKDWSSLAVGLDYVNLDKVAGEENYRKLDDTFFDFKNLKVKNKFIDYLEPCLGRPDLEDEYVDLLKKINK